MKKGYPKHKSILGIHNRVAKQEHGTDKDGNKQADFWVRYLITKEVQDAKRRKAEAEKKKLQAEA